MRAFPSLLAFALVGGCTPHDSSGSRPADAGDESSPPKAARDGGEGRSQDAASDGAVADAGPASNPYPGVWAPLPSAPIDCRTVVARTPEASVPPFAWRACSSGRSGCQSFDADWSPEARGARLTRARVEPRMIDGVPHFLFVRTHRAGTAATFDVAVVQSLTGPARFALGGPHPDSSPSAPLCSGTTGFGPQGVAFSWHYARGASPERSWLSWSGWDGPRADVDALASAPVDETALGGYVMQVAPSAGAVFLGVRRAAIASVVFDTQTRTFRESAADAGALSAAHAKPVVDGAIVHGGSEPYGLHLVDTRGGHTPLVSATAGFTVADFALDRSANDALVWLEAKELGLSRTSYSLWSAPYAATERALHRRKVAVIPDAAMEHGRGVAVNAGLVLLRLDNGEGLLARLEDGKKWRIRGEPDRALSYPLWVDDAAVWFVTSSFVSDPSGPPDGLLRIDRSTLGSPTEPSGL